MQVCARSHVCGLACGTGLQKFDFFSPKKIAIMIEADNGIFHDHRAQL